MPEVFHTPLKRSAYKPPRGYLTLTDAWPGIHLAINAANGGMELKNGRATNRLSGQAEPRRVLMRNGQPAFDIGTNNSPLHTPKDGLTTLNDGYVITMMVQKGEASGYATGRIYMLGSAAVYAYRNAADTSIVVKHDFRTHSATGLTSLWDGDVHVFTVAARTPTTAGATYEIWIDGILESTLSPGTQSSLDVGGSIWALGGDASTLGRGIGLMIGGAVLHTVPYEAEALREISTERGFWSNFKERRVRTIYLGAAAAPPSGRVMSSLAASGGLAGKGGIAGIGGGLAA